MKKLIVHSTWVAFLGVFSPQVSAIVKPRGMLPAPQRSTEQVGDRDAQRAAKDLQVRRVQNMLSAPRTAEPRLSQEP